MRVTKADVLESLQKLLEVYQRPRRWPDLNAVGDRWLEILGDLDREELRAGVQDQLRTTDEFMPKPGKIRKHALAHRVARGGTGLQAKYLDWQRGCWQDPDTGHDAPCPVCGAMPEWRPRRIVVHNLASHLRQGVPVIGEHDGRMPPADVAAPPPAEAA